MVHQKLILELLEECEYAYAPYSNFHISACVLCKDGTRYKGVNIENASYGLCMCAERVALYKAISERVKKEDIVSIYIVNKGESLVYPCGACRQVMQEFMDKDSTIIVANKTEYKVHTLEELMPYAFSEEDLKWNLNQDLYQ